MTEESLEGGRGNKTTALLMEVGLCVCSPCDSPVSSKGIVLMWHPWADEVEVFPTKSFF